MDWKNVVIKAKANTGFTQPVLAREIGCSQSAISALLTGRNREPKYGLGQKLLALAGYLTTEESSVDRSPGAATSPDIQAAAAGQGV